MHRTFEKIFLILRDDDIIFLKTKYLWDDILHFKKKHVKNSDKAYHT
jgi:hypothetical protein